MVRLAVSVDSGPEAVALAIDMLGASSSSVMVMLAVSLSPIVANPLVTLPIVTMTVSSPSSSRSLITGMVMVVLSLDWLIVAVPLRLV